MIAINKKEYHQGFPIVCCLCDEKITSIHDRHNAQPIINGWCCSLCNTMKVIPYRIKVLIGGKK